MPSEAALSLSRACRASRIIDCSECEVAFLCVRRVQQKEGMKINFCTLSRGARRSTLTIFLLLVAGMFCLTGQANAEALPSAAEMWKMVQAQQKQIDELKAQLNQVNHCLLYTSDAADE